MSTMHQFFAQKAGAVVSSSSVDAQIEAKFGPQPKPKLSIVPGSQPVPAKVVPETPKDAAPEETIFQLQPQEEPVIRIARGKKALQKAPQDPCAKPSVLVEYEATLEGGNTMTIPEYAHLALLDQEVLTLGFPISQRSRLRPARGTNLNIKTRHGTHSCYSTGIHTDIPEWGVSMSIFLINPEEKA
jgi:hypothetical protein